MEFQRQRPKRPLPSAIDQAFAPGFSAIVDSGMRSCAMKFPNYWTRVTNPTGTVSARGWSDTSLDEAQANAENRLSRIINALQNNRARDLDNYSYVVDNVICEEVIDRIVAADNERAVISRNAYGALILNTKHLMIVDIDLPNTARGCLAALFPKKKSSGPSPQQQILDRIHAWQASNPRTSVRIYKTFNGYRVMMPSMYVDEIDSQVVDMMAALGSDPLYIKLCRSQSCFRARLSPKPWRINLATPPTRFPFGDGDQQEAFEKWNQEYIQKAKEYAVCQFVSALGEDDPKPEHLALIELHDQLCCSSQPKPLA